VISQWRLIRSCAAVTTFVIAVCICGSQAVALTLPAGPTGPVPVTAPVAPTLPSTTVPVAPKPPSPTPSTPKVSVPKVSAPKVSAPKVSAPKVSAPTLGNATSPTGGGSAGTTAGSTDQVSNSLRLPLLSSVSRLTSGSTGTSGGGLSSTLGGLTGSGGGPAGPGTGPGAGSGPGAGGGAGGGSGAGGGAGGSLSAAVAVLLRAEAGIGAEALAGVRGAGFEALQAAVASLAGCAGELAPLQQRVLMLRFGLGGGSPRSLGAVARALGISRAAALRTQSRALRSLRVASTTTGCAAAGAGIAVIFDPTTIGTPAVALLGASAPANGLSAGGPLGARATGAAAPVWPGVSREDIGWLLVALATLGALLTLAGVLLRGWTAPLPFPAGGVRALERIRRRPGAAAGRRRRASGRGPQPLAPRVRYRRPDKRSDS